MNLLEKFKDQGWHLTEEGVQKLSKDVATEDLGKLIKEALNWDMKEVAAGALPTKPDSNGYINGRIVVQIQRIRNISAPKANEESTAAPRFLKLELTDGVNTIQSLELERINNLNMNIPPGTKLYLKSDKLQLMQGFLMLKPNDVQILGGNVEHLVEKWEVARQMQKYARTGTRMHVSSSGPPPWIAFGKRLDAHKDALTQDRNFKSLQVAGENDKNSKENEEFNNMRSEAIAEAAKAGSKKVFGGGQQNILDHNVKKILDKGYSEEEAKVALKITNNNLERALYNLKRRKERNQNNQDTNNKMDNSTTTGGRRQRGGRNNVVKEETTVNTKPAANVSLSDFLTNILPTASDTATVIPSMNSVTYAGGLETKNNQQQQQQQQSQKKNADKVKFENNMSASFAANRTSTTLSFSDGRQITDRRHRPNREDRRSDMANNNNNNSTNGKNNTERSIKKDTEQMPRRSTSFSSQGGYQGNKKRNEYKQSQSKQQQQQQRQSKHSTQQDYKQGNTNVVPGNSNNNNTNNNSDNNVETLVELTAKVKISNKRDNYYTTRSEGGGRRHQQSKQTGITTKQQQPQQQQQQQHQQIQKTSVATNNNSIYVNTQQFMGKTQTTATPTAAVAKVPAVQNQQPTGFVNQLCNGLPYDPSKIMGFQSKEANEYAMNLLKSQGLTLTEATPASASCQQITQSAPPSSQILNVTATATFVANAIPFPNLTTTQPPPPPVAYDTTLGANWPWKKGDLCLAKYWEDGKYYEAEVTDITDKTCVVIFRGYGNFEEVLKTDCLPITDAQQRTVNTYETNMAIMTANPMPLQAASDVTLAATQMLTSAQQPFQRNNSHRYRSERQMYVPPHKRSGHN